MSIELPAQLEVWVNGQVQSGKFDSGAAVVKQALELLQLQTALESDSFLSENLQRRTALAELVELGQEQKLGY